MVGVFDLIKSYAGPRTLSLALMLIDPSSRGQGIGNKANHLLEKWVISQQFNKVRLGNEKGLKFWKKMGFAETGEIKPHLSKKFMVLEKNIGVHDR
ncbi:GNAT family N-acetyltransferase [Desulfosporosinus metallidurans]|nr:GNAT family N-acetyltransferase [Desulfosporosinus metallidurans]